MKISKNVIIIQNRDMKTIKIVLKINPIGTLIRFVLLFLISISIFFPFLVLGFIRIPITPGFLLSVLIFWGVGGYFIRLFLWNIGGAEIFIFNQKYLFVYNYYNCFKVLRKKVEISNFSIHYTITQTHVTRINNESKSEEGVLVFLTSKERIVSVIPLSVSELIEVKKKIENYMQL